MVIVALIGRNSAILKDIETSDIEEITFHDTYERFTITKQSDVQILFKELQSMKFKRVFAYHKFGAAFVIDIKLKNSKEIKLSILSDDIIINDLNYLPDKDYIDEISSIFNTMSQKYKVNPE